MISFESRLDASWGHCYGFYAAGEDMLLGAYLENYWGIYCKMGGERFVSSDLTRLVIDLMAAASVP